VHSGRPHPCIRLLLVSCLVTLAGLLPAVASAAGGGGFHRDETPLPADVTGVGRGAHANLESAASGGSGGGTVLHMLLALGVVIALILGLYKLLRRTAHRNDGAVRADGKMAIVASTPLAHSRSLHLVRVGEELVLVGSAEQAVTPIRVYSAEESRMLVLEDPGDMRQLDAGGKPGVVSSLADSLRKLTAR
jgi:flagellar protein FliO/FliZ